MDANAHDHQEDAAADAVTAVDPFAGVLGSHRGRAEPEVDTALSTAPSERALADLTRIKESLVFRKKLDQRARAERAAQSSLALLTTAARSRETRPLLEGVREALGRWAAADAEARTTSLAVILLEDAGFRSQHSSEHILGALGISSSRYNLVHLWADGHHYGHPSLAPSIRLLCSIAPSADGLSSGPLRPEESALLPRGSWRDPSSSEPALDRRRCPDCSESLRQKTLGSSIGAERIDGEAREHHLGQSALPYHSAARHRHHLVRVCTDRLVSPPADLLALRAVAATDYWAQLLHNVSNAARYYPTGVLDRAGVPLSKKLRSQLLTASPSLKRADWREMLGHLLPDVDGDIAVLGDPRTWEGWSHPEARRERRERYQKALTARCPH